MALAAAPEIPGLRALSPLAHGPASTIYSAQSVTMGRWVAVVVYSVTLRDEQSQRRFRRGYEMSRRLGAHPHAVTVLEYGTTAPGQAYLVTELYEHGTLENQIQGQQPMRVGEVLRLGIALAGALDTAHRAGVIHGGIHPARVLLADDREPALADLALVPLVDRTGLAALVGPMTYHAPPEVLEGESLVPATDVYSLASTLYAALSGRAPYAPEPGEPDGLGDTTASLLLRILQHNIPAIGRRDVPPSLEKILDQGLSSEARYRPPRPLAFAKALQSCQVELGLAPSQPIILDLPATLNAVDPGARAPAGARPRRDEAPPRAGAAPPPTRAPAEPAGRGDWTAALSLPPPPPLPEVRLPNTSATLSPPTPAIATAPATDPIEGSAEPSGAAGRVAAPAAAALASAIAAAPASGVRAEAAAPAPAPPAMPLPGPMASPPPPQVFVPYSPPEPEGDEDGVPGAPAAGVVETPELGLVTDGRAGAPRPVPVPGRTGASRTPARDRRPERPAMPPRTPAPARPGTAGGAAETPPGARALPVIVLAVLVAVIFAGVTWSILAGDGTEDERARPDDPRVSADVGSQASSRGGLTAVESSLGVQLDWDSAGGEPPVVVVFSTTEPPRTLPADTGTALVIPTSTLNPGAGYCFAVVSAPAPVPPAGELASEVPDNDLSPDACIRNGSVDTVRRS